MGKLQFYKFATLGLLLLNVSMIAFFLLTKPPHHHSKEGRTTMRADQRMHLDKAQHQTFLDYADKHKVRMKAINEKQGELLKPYFYTLVDTTQEVNTQNILEEVKTLEGQKIEFVYQHFKEVKSVLRKEQYVYFKSFVDNVFERIVKGKKDSNPPKDF